MSTKQITFFSPFTCNISLILSEIFWPHNREPSQKLISLHLCKGVITSSMAKFSCSQENSLWDIAAIQPPELGPQSSSENQIHLSREKKLVSQGRWWVRHHTVQHNDLDLYEDRNKIQLKKPGGGCFSCTCAAQPLHYNHLANIVYFLLMPPAAPLTFQDMGKGPLRVSSGTLAADPLALVRLGWSLCSTHDSVPSRDWEFGDQVKVLQCVVPWTMPELCLWSGRTYYSALRVNIFPANGYIVMRKSFLFTSNSVFLIFLADRCIMMMHLYIDKEQPKSKER